MQQNQFGGEKFKIKENCFEKTASDQKTWL